jgi:hypothetical protein
MPSLRTATVRVTGADGVPWEGSGTTLRQAVCDLVRRRAAGRPSREPRSGHPHHPAADGSPQTLQRHAAEGEALVTVLCRAVACSEDPLEAAPASAAEVAP